jgi:hypothetical protein
MADERLKRGPLKTILITGKPQMDEQAPPQQPKPFVGILMKCCRTYVRAYLNSNGDRFIGRCPRCAAIVRINVAEEGGSRNQFFEAC